MADPVVHLTNGVPDSGTGNITTLGAVVAKQPALGTAGSASADVITVQGIASGTVLPVSAASLPLPTGASTSALQTTGNTSLASIATNTSSAVPAGTNVIGKMGIDQTTDGTTNAVRLIAETTKVIGTVNVAASQNIGIVPATSGGLSRSRTLIPNNVTAIVVKASAGQLYKIRATNNSATIAYIKLYDAASATAGAGTIVDTIMIPAASAGGAGVADFYSDFGVPHTTGITYCVTTGIADADTTAPAASAYIVTVFYK